MLHADYSTHTHSHTHTHTHTHTRTHTQGEESKQRQNTQRWDEDKFTSEEPGMAMTVDKPVTVREKTRTDTLNSDHAGKTVTTVTIRQWLTQTRQ